MSKTALIFSGASGLNTVIDPIRLFYNPETGISDLGVAVNVTIEETGSIGRRAGYSRLIDLTGAHSLFCDGGICLVVAGSILYQIMPDFVSIREVTSLTSNNRMAFCQVNDDIYYTNGVDLGIVDTNGQYVPWVMADYVGPETNKLFDGPRAGNHLAFLASRIFVFEENILWWSEPFSFSQFDRTRNYIQFPSNGRMIKPVTNGLFVSDSEKTFFLTGLDPKDFEQKVVSIYPAVEWSDTIDYIEGLEIGLQEPGLCALWATHEGACMGTPLGALINLNKQKVIYPEYGTQGAGLLKGYNYIHSIGV